MFTKTKTLDGILAGFRKTADELAAFIDQKVGQMGEIDAERHRLDNEFAAASADHSKATVVRQKLLALIEG